MAYRYILAGKDDDTIHRLACVPYDIITLLRSEVNAVKTALSTLDIVTYNYSEPDGYSNP